jgi:hypothetical protein
MEIAYTSPGCVRVGYVRIGGDVTYSAAVSEASWTVGGTVVINGSIGVTSTRPENEFTASPHNTAAMSLPDVWFEGAMEITTEILPSAASPTIVLGRYELRKVRTG